MRFSVYCMGPECFASGCGLYCAMMIMGDDVGIFLLSIPKNTEPVQTPHCTECGY